MSDLPTTDASRQVLEQVARNLEIFRKTDVWRIILIDPDHQSFDQRAQHLEKVHEEAAVRQQIAEEEEIISLSSGSVYSR